MEYLMKLKNLTKEIKYYVRLEGFSRPFKKFVLYQSPLSKIVNTPFYNKIYMKRIIKRAKKINPKILQIETTNACNAKCLMCPHSFMKRKVRTMDLEEFKKILDNVMKSYLSIDRLTINGFGEPFMDKGIMEKIQYANKEYPRLKVDLYSNAGMLTKEKANELLKTKLGRVTFSINGAEKEDYEKVMGINYEKTKSNVLYFLNERKRLKNEVLVNISMMVLKENEKKAKEFINFWKPLSDSVRVYFPSDWAGELKTNLGEQYIPYDRKQWPCTAPLTHIVIHSRGEFVLCCRDFNSGLPLGNLLKGDDIKILREGEEFKRILGQHLNFDFSFLLCKNCDHAYDSSVEWWLW